MARLLVWLILMLGLAAPAAPAPATPAAQRAQWKKLYERPVDVPFPATDAYSENKARLGKTLFFDPVLSGTGLMSCASCHNPSLSWGDGLARAIGVKGQKLPSQTPTVLDAAWVPELGWEGRYGSLEDMVFVPINAPTIMDRKTPDLLAALAAIPGYHKEFAAAFPDGKITRQHIEMAIATFERTVVTGESPFDRWIGGDEHAIPEAAKRGFDLFNGKAGCAECHSGWNFTDGAFYDIGTATGSDIGRGHLFPDGPKLRYAFKVPTLRDVARRAPYMHNGSEPTLAAVIELYNRGGIDRPSRSDLIKPLDLTAAEKSDLVAFLRTLTEDPAPYAMPPLPR